MNKIRQIVCKAIKISQILTENTKKKPLLQHFQKISLNFKPKISFLNYKSPFEGGIFEERSAAPIKSNIKSKPFPEGQNQTKKKNSRRKHDKVHRRIQKKAQEEAEKITEEMEKRYDEDLKLFEMRKLANRKEAYMKVLSERLKYVTVWEKFLEKGGLQQLELWLTSGIYPTLKLRKDILKLLLSLSIKPKYISKVSSIRYIVKKYSTSKSSELCQLSHSILLKWSKTLHERKTRDKFE